MGKGKKHGKLRVFIILFLCALVIVPALFIGLSFIGRITPEQIIPGSARVYAEIPDPASFAARLVSHETFPRILEEPSLSFLAPVIADFRASGILDSFWVRAAAGGKLCAALLEDGQFLAAWDMGVISSVFRLLPFLAGQITVPHLYYVQAGKNSRFEYRPEEGRTLFIGRYKNLLVIANNSRLFESVLADGLPAGAAESFRGTPVSRGHDAVVFVSADFAVSALTGAENGAAGAEGLSAILGQMKFPGRMEVALNIAPARIDLSLSTPVSPKSAAFDALISRDSRVTGFLNLLPETSQYATILSAGRLREVLEAARAAAGSVLETNLRKAESAANMLFGFGLEELAFSWTGEEFAVFGLEGRPYPVFAIRIADEAKRRAVFDEVFSSAFISEDLSTVLDGTRVPRIRLPGFLDSFLRFWDVIVPSPYYYVHEGFLFVSESSDSLLAALSAIRRNNILPKTQLWKTLAHTGSDEASFSLFYSLDRSLPFFLKGNAALISLLRLYRQGLLRVHLENKTLTLKLSAIPGSGKGLRLVSGYPLNLEGKIGNEVYAALCEKKGEARILLTRGTRALALDPSGAAVYEYEADTEELWCLPAEGIPASTAQDALAWVVTRQGQVALVNGGMKAEKGFPLVTGCRLSAPPAAFGGKLYLTEGDSVFALDRTGSLTQFSFPFDGAALRSPPSLLSVSGKTYMGLYPKSFAGELWLADGEGRPYPGWPVRVSGIAFGSPLVFTNKGEVCAAFITQAGSLSVFTEAGSPVAGFPVELPGVFHIQPVWDGDFLWALSAEGVLFRVGLAGEILSQTIAGLKAREGGLHTADVDGDGTPEIFLSGEANALYGYSRAFTLLAGFPLPVWGRAAFADFNADGMIECVGAGLDDLVYRWQFNK